MADTDKMNTSTKPLKIAMGIVIAGIGLSACVSTPTRPPTSSTSELSGPPQASGKQTDSEATAEQHTTATPPAQPQTQPSAEHTDNTAASSRTDDEILAEALEVFAGQSKDMDGDMGGDPPGSANTEAEKTEQLDEELNDRFAEFDRLMLKKRQAVQAEANREGSGRRMDLGNGSGSNGVFGDEDGDMDALHSANARPSRPSQDSRQRHGNEPVAADVQSESHVPEDLASTEGDDVIARQLREAAMKEPDPELREKLWDEYRKYKKSL